MKIKPCNEKLVQLVKLLNDGQYHDGNVLGQTMDVTRSAIWKMIKKLEQYGIAIHSIQSNGYALSEPLILLDYELIKKTLSYDIELVVLESISSTNDYFKLSGKDQTMLIQCCLAEHQTQARGRLNRVWHSPFGKNIYLSCYYPFQQDISELAGLSLVVSLAVLATLRALGFNDGVVKWPNDILYHGKKIAGILIDVEAESHGVSLATIGIGLNVNMTSADNPTIDQSWTSLHEECDVALDRNHVSILLIQNLLEYVSRFEQQGFSIFAEEWEKFDGLIKKIVTLDYLRQQISGKVVGINPKGHLLIQLLDGNVRAFSSGEVSLLKN